LEQLEQAARRLTYSFGPFLLEPTERRLVRDGRDLRLSPKVFETLVLLVERHGLLVDKDDLMKTLWPETFVEEVTLARNISLLRKALGDTPGQDQSQYIETVSKRGYRFIAEVKEVYEQVAESNGSTEMGSDRGLPQKTSTWWRRLPAWIVAAGFVLLVIGGVALWRSIALRLSAVRINSLAVLPLENLSGDPDQEYFADGMTDELITDLAQIHSLRVISRTSVMQFKHTKKSLPEIAKDLNVDAVVQGSVSRSEQNVHITAQLLDAHQDRHLWAASYERRITDILGLQTQVAKAIADQVQANLTPQENARLTKHPPRNPEAYDALLKGRFLRNKRMANSLRALPYFQQSVAIDPTDAEAWEELADSYAHLGADLGFDPAVMGPQARAALAKALELDPDLASAHATSGWLKLWYDWDWAGAEREFRRAIELNPNDSAAHRYYAHYFRVLRRFDEALEEDRRALDLAPLDIFPHALLAWIYRDARLADKTIEQSKLLLETAPTFTGAYQYLGRGYELKGQWPEAMAAYEHLKESYSGAYWHGVIYLWAVTGKKNKIVPVLASMKEDARHDYISPMEFAECYAALGDREQAFEWLERAYREHATSMIHLEVNYYFDTLRTDPRFRDLERRVGFR
jgi:TolB-like protein/DNA-binding winged helix-turn-helix (wHTH) protein/Flp pilus assembly protein TadD